MLIYQLIISHQYLNRILGILHIDIDIDIGIGAGVGAGILIEAVCKYQAR